MFRQGMASHLAKERRALLLAGFAAIMAVALACGCSGSEPAQEEEQPKEEHVQQDDSQIERSQDVSANTAGGVDELVEAGIPEDAIVDVATLKELVDADAAVVVDIRSGYAYEPAFIAGSINIPAGNQLELRANEIPGTGDIYLIDANQTRVTEAYAVLQELGVEKSRLHVVVGGMGAWNEADYPVAHSKINGC